MEREQITKKNYIQEMSKIYATREDLQKMFDDIVFHMDRKFAVSQAENRTHFKVIYKYLGIDFAR